MTKLKELHKELANILDLEVRSVSQTHKFTSHDKSLCQYLIQERGNYVYDGEYVYKLIIKSNDDHDGIIFTVNAIKLSQPELKILIRESKND